MAGSGEGFLKEFLLAVAVSVVAVILLSPGVYGTPEIAEREDRSCLVCHTALGRAELNDAGKYYGERRTLDGYPGELPPRLGRGW